MYGSQFWVMTVTVAAAAVGAEEPLRWQKSRFGRSLSYERRVELDRWRSRMLLAASRSAVIPIVYHSQALREGEAREVAEEARAAPAQAKLLRRLLCAPCALVGVTTAMHGYCVCNVLCRHGITQSSPHAFLWIASVNVKGSGDLRLV